ncbi:hypothetical protein F5Y14DRAFT_308179 [Nemania sp. NC0429]|nr:hypothetical protein F5Y14DRAFT_308179 [Nemania sp. NC0429]
MELLKLEDQALFQLADHDPLLEHVSRLWEDRDWIQRVFVRKVRDQSNKELKSKIICSLLQRDREGVLPNARQIVIPLLESGCTRSLRIDMSNGLPDKEENSRFLQLLDNCFLSGLQGYVDELLGLSIQTFNWLPTKTTPSMFNYNAPRQQPNTQISAEEMLYSMSKSFEKNKLSSRPARDFFLAILRKFVLKDKPAPPRKLDGHGYAHKPRGCGGRKCKLCPELDRFLTSSTEEQRQFLMMDEYQSRHIETQLPSDLFGCMTVSMATIAPATTTGNTKLFALTVVKLVREDEKEMREYEGRVEKLVAKVRPLRTEYVRTLLGDGPYGECVMLDGLLHGDGIALREAGNSKTNEKRRAEDDLQGLQAKR